MTDYTELLRDKSTWESGWQTRNGKPVRILANDLGGWQPIAAAFDCGHGGLDVAQYCANGWLYRDCSSTYDLVPRPVKHKGWVNIFRGSRVIDPDGNHYATIYSTRDEADSSGASDRIACIEIEFFEGEGLEDRP